MLLLLSLSIIELNYTLRVVVVVVAVVVSVSVEVSFSSWTSLKQPKLARSVSRLDAIDTLDLLWALKLFLMSLCVRLPNYLIELFMLKRKDVNEAADDDDDDVCSLFFPWHREERRQTGSEVVCLLAACCPWSRSSLASLASPPSPLASRQ